jgi:hypothetical protein
MVQQVHVNCPHCQQSVTVKIGEPSGQYGVYMVWAEPGPSVATLDRRKQ